MLTPHPHAPALQEKKGQIRELIEVTFLEQAVRDSKIRIAITKHSVAL